MPYLHQASEVTVVVITDEVRQKLFGSSPALGKIVNIGGEPRRVVGVVPSVPFTQAVAYSTLWIPLGPPTDQGDLLPSLHEQVVRRLELQGHDLVGMASVSIAGIEDHIQQLLPHRAHIPSRAGARCWSRFSFLW